MAKKPTAKTVPSANPDQISINFNAPIEMPSVYATNVVIQPGEYEVVISFFEVQPPMFTSQDEKENLAILKKVGVRADCVARVTIAKDRFEGFANAMKQIATGMKAVGKRK